MDKAGLLIHGTAIELSDSFVDFTPANDHSLVMETATGPGTEVKAPVGGLQPGAGLPSETGEGAGGTWGPCVHIDVEEEEEG